MKSRRFVKVVNGMKVRTNTPMLVRYLRYAPPARVHLEELGMKPGRFGF